MKDFFNKKNIIIISIISGVILLLITCLLLWFIFKERFIFRLIGETNITLNVYEQYKEFGVEAHTKKEDLKETVVIDSSKVDMNNLGTYEVTYKVTYKEKEYVLTRTVDVVDNQKPVLTLIGGEEVVVKEGHAYNEQGCTAVDNYDEKIY
jgi:hypothetical protein